MKLFTNLMIVENESEEEVCVSCVPGTNIGHLAIFISKDKKFEDFLQKENFEKLVNEQIKLLEPMDFDRDFVEEEIEFLKKLLASKTNISDMISNLFIFITDDVIEYIDNNPLLKTKTIYLNDELNPTKEDLELLDEKFKGVEDLKIIIPGNSTYITYSDYKRTVEEIESIIQKIQKYDLSPIEKTMYAYDLVRDRFYVSEDENEDTKVSRDLTDVLLGDKIVCVGFANILDQVLQSLGINCRIISLIKKDKKSGHVRNMVEIKDDKYNINGVYFLDPTWDCKDKDNESAFLDSYRFFANSKETIDSYSSKYIDESLNDYDDSFCWRFEEIVEEKGIFAVPKKMAFFVNYLSKFIDNQDIISSILMASIYHNIDIGDPNSFNLEAAMEKLNKYREMFFDSLISPEVMIQILFNVRIKEYYENPEKYKLDVEKMVDIIYNSRWYSKKASVEESVLSLIFDEQLPVRSISKQEIYNKIKSIEELQNIEREVEGVKLANVLKKTLENKKLTLK